MEFVPFEDGIEVNGQTVYAIVDGFGSFRRLAENLLLEEGIGERGSDKTYRLDPSGWYLQAAWLRVFQDVSVKVGQAVLYDIGARIPANAQFPDWVVDVPSAIRAIDIAYHMNHRKGGRVMFDAATGTMLEGIGHYGFSHVPGEPLVTSRCENPYPCAFDHGIVTAMARRFDPRARVTHLDGACRQRGANACVYQVSIG